MAESRKDQLVRLRLMADGNSQWDLSPNDREALLSAIDFIDECFRIARVRDRGDLMSFVEDEAERCGFEIE